jgi:uncharacterized protein (DUF433 family)
MSLAVTAESPPLVTDADGVVRIASTRVTLDTLVAAYREGMTAEGIVEQYPSLRLADVYSAIGYILNHEDQVQAYLREREVAVGNVRRENEACFPPGGVRARLLARRGKR